MKDNKIIEIIIKCSAFLCIMFVVLGLFLYGTVNKSAGYRNEVKLADVKCKSTTIDWKCNSISWVDASTCDTYSFYAPSSGNTWNKIAYREVNSNVCKNFHSINDKYCCQVTTCTKTEMCASCNSGYYLNSGDCKTCTNGSTLKKDGCVGDENFCCEKSCYEFKNNTCSSVSVSGTTCNESNKQYSTWEKCRANIVCSGDNDYIYGNSCLSCGSSKKVKYKGCQGNSLTCCEDNKTTPTPTCSVENCDTCVSGSTTKCSVCNTGYHVNSSGGCDADTQSTTCTAANCKTCVSGSTTKCSVCNSGYHVLNNNCVQDVTSCPEGQGKNSFGACENCAAGYWSPAGSISCATKCEEGYACKNGVKTKCSVATPAGSSECYTCDVSNCKTCEQYKKDVCATCKSGYSLNSKGKCYWSGGSSTPTPKDACYKNTTTNEYVYGQYDGQVGYSKLANDQSSCNKVLIKLVDDKGFDLQGAIITVTSSLNPSSPTNYNIGKKDLEVLAPGTYKIKETAAPTNYQIDSYEIEVTIDSLGIVNVKTTSSNVDLGTTNNTRNVTITWKNLAVASSNPPVDEEEEKCYIKHDADAENEYCYGKKEDCSSYTDVLTGRDNKSCKEDAACYTDSTGAYVSGKYANRDEYKYYAASCPKCYKNQNGELTWGSFEDVEGFTLEPNVAKDKCKTNNTTSSSGNSKLIYIILIILIIAAIIFVALKGKPKNNIKDDEDDTEEDNYNYNYHV